MLCDEDSVLSFWHRVRQFTERLFLVPVPPPGLLAVVSGGELPVHGWLGYI